MSRSNPDTRRRSDRFLKGAGALAWMTSMAVRTAFAFMQVFPVEWNLQTAKMVARLWVRLMPRHRQRALANLEAAFGRQFSAAELNVLADRSLQSVVMFAVEAVCLARRINAFTWSRHIRLVNFDGALKVFLEGRGAVLVTGHYGSFELIGHFLAALRFDVVAVMRPLDNVYLNEFIVASRKTHGLTLLDKKGAATWAEQRLSEGSLVCFIGDQDAGRKGLFVDFFGRPASTYKSIGLLAMSANVPVIVGYARRLGDRAQYEIGVQRVIQCSEWQLEPDPLRWITQEYTQAIEQFVRQAPEQYLWAHRRWKTQPAEKRDAAGRVQEAMKS